MKQRINAILAETPDLKAREIAKILGDVERKDVSAFLHGNSDHYRQNDKYQWSLVPPRKVVLSLYSGWMTAGQFERCLKEAGSVLELDGTDVEIVFPQKCKPMIDALARILALLNQMANRGQHVTADFTSCTGTLSYLNRAGFFEMLDHRIDVLPSWPTTSAAERHRGQSDTLVEFGPIDPKTENEDLIGQLTETFITQSSSDYRVAALTIFGELIGNVYEHSEAGMPGFAGLQKYKGYNGKPPHIQSVVSDSGLGIARTLRSTLHKHHKELYKKFKKETPKNDAGLVEKAMSSGEISKNGPGGGLGFKSSREQATKFNAQYTVRQNRFSLRFEFHEGKLIKVERKFGLPLLDGTHICFDFFLD